MQNINELINLLNIKVIDNTFNETQIFYIYEKNDAIIIIKELERLKIDIFGFNCWTYIDNHYEFFHMAYGTKWFFLDWSTSADIDKNMQWNENIEKINEAEQYAIKNNHSIFFELIYNKNNTKE